jgi:hypothetical protein
MGERALGLHALKLHGDRACLGGANPDRQHPRAIFLPQDDNRSIGGPIETEMRYRNFNHRLTRSGAGVPAREIFHLFRGQ